MSRLKWSEIRAGLRRECSVPEPGEAKRFWIDFRARARLGPGPEAVGSAPLRPWVWRWRWALATVAVVGLLVFPLTRRVGSEQTREAGSEIEAIEVFVPYSALMIMQDQESGASVVWLADLEPGKDT